MGNDAWLQLVLCAQGLAAWAQALGFDGALAMAEPKRLRHRVLHAAAVIVHTGGQTIVRFQRNWPWVDGDWPDSPHPCPPPPRSHPPAAY